MKNQDRYKTAKERAEAFDKFCRQKGFCDVDCILSDRSNEGVNTCVCFAYWLDLEAEENPLPCPFCGGVCCTATVITRTGSSSEYVSCNDCSYCSGNKPIGEAIAAHNRVAKKCMEVKE